MSSANSAFTHSLETHQGKKFLCIEDNFNTTPGEMIKTVTNNIENVVDDICSFEKINANDYFIIYRDTDDDWSLWDHLTESHIPGILTKSKQQAIYQVIEKTKS